MSVFAVIPSLNEGTRLNDVVRQALNHVDHVIVIDDGSNQQHAVQLNEFDKRVVSLRHRINLGKGAALRTGIEAAIQLGAEFIIFLDADGQHNPVEIPNFLNKIRNENLDIVFGSRTIGKDMPLVMMLGNKFLSIATSLLFGIYISDTQSGFRCIRANAYPQLRWQSSRYAVETEIIVNTARHKLRFGEIRIQTIYHDDYKGTTIIDGIRIFINMLKWKIL